MGPESGLGLGTLGIRVRVSVWVSTGVTVYKRWVRVRFGAKVRVGVGARVGLGLGSGWGRG